MTTVKIFDFLSPVTFISGPMHLRFVHSSLLYFGLWAGFVVPDLRTALGALISPYRSAESYLPLPITQLGKSIYSPYMSSHGIGLSAPALAPIDRLYLFALPKLSENRFGINLLIVISDRFWSRSSPASFTWRA